MADWMWVIDTNTSTTKADPVMRYCAQRGIVCELANERGYCSITACTKQEV